MKKLKTITLLLLVMIFSGCMNNGCFSNNRNVLNALSKTIVLVLKRNYELSNDCGVYEFNETIRDTVCLWDVSHNKDLSLIADDDRIDFEIEKRIDYTCKTGLMRFVVDKLSGNQNVHDECYIEHLKRNDAYNPFNQ